MRSPDRVEIALPYGDVLEGCIGISPAGKYIDIPLKSRGKTAQLAAYNCRVLGSRFSHSMKWDFVDAGWLVENILQVSGDAKGLKATNFGCEDDGGWYWSVRLELEGAGGDIIDSDLIRMFREKTNLNFIPAP